MENSITIKDIDDSIVQVDYHCFPGGKLTVCCATMANGFQVVGEAACVDPANFNKELGEKISLENAKEKMWALMGYSLQDKLFLGSQS